MVFPSSTMQSDRVTGVSCIRRHPARLYGPGPFPAAKLMPPVPFAAKKNSDDHEIPDSPPRRQSQHLLDAVEAIADEFRASGPKSEELGTLAPDAVQASRDRRPVSPQLARRWAAPRPDPLYRDGRWKISPITTSPAAGAPWSARTAIAGLGARRRPRARFKDGKVPTASTSVFRPAAPRRKVTAIASRPLALQQRHPPRRVGDRRRAGWSAARRTTTASRGRS